MAESSVETGRNQLERWISFGTQIVAPATVLSALLFYFGYVSSRSQYQYFGLDVDTIGLSTQDYVMRSPQPLLVPLLVLTLIGIGLVMAHGAIAKRIEATAAPGIDAPDLRASYHRFARMTVTSGLVLLSAGLVGLIGYPYLREWSLYALVTPVSLAVGTGLVAYAARIRSRLGGPTPSEGGRPNVRPRTENSMPASRRSSTGLLVVVIVANVFWSTATVAQWSGRGLARYDATHLTRLPSVIIDTHERLFLHSPGVEETALPASAGQTFRFRYRHLRLLIQGHDRMFLVPDRWSANDSTLVVTLDGSVRVQFQFQNDAP